MIRIDRSVFDDPLYVRSITYPYPIPSEVSTVSLQYDDDPHTSGDLTIEIVINTNHGDPRGAVAELARLLNVPITIETTP
jgi:hypothetical protein